ncbi:MAG: N-acyl homoserine lactonase family protein [Deltaproteobacteria bacterium]|nr:N-acyl homoserine lactonase family protein [Deltaproteobacteria bacterium]
MRLHALTCGWLEGALGNFLEGERGSIRVPVPCFLVEHPRGLVLFDAGMHPQTQHDPEGRLGPIAGVFTVHFAPGEEVAGRLAALGIDAARVDLLINSHLHFDHSGGNALIPNARLVVQRREWEAGHDADQIARQFYGTADYQLGHDVLQVDGEYDVFGDGRVVCLPTYGHTPGHQSLRVRLDSGEVVLTADACYLRRTLENLHLPAIVDDPDGMRRSLLALRKLRDAGARIIVGHDPEDWATVPALMT